MAFSVSPIHEAVIPFALVFDEDNANELDGYNSQTTSISTSEMTGATRSTTSTISFELSAVYPTQMNSYRTLHTSDGGSR